MTHTHHVHHEGCHHLVMIDEDECVCGAASSGLYCCDCEEEVGT